MSIYRFPLKTIQKVRHHIRNSLVLPDLEPQAFFGDGFGEEEMPEPDSIDDLSGLFATGGTSSLDMPSSIGGAHWFLSTVNPAVALLKLPGLTLKEEFRMVNYLYRSGESGAGVVWAVPEEMSSTAQLEQVLKNCDTLSRVPKPDGALLHFMEAIAGDHSPPSFIIASILRRELQELGTLGERCSWSLHRLIDGLPNEWQWEWLDEAPKDLSPKVRLLKENEAAVEFFTCRTTAPVKIYRHLDRYPADQYKAKSLDKAIAVAT